MNDPDYTLQSQVGSSISALLATLVPSALATTMYITMFLILRRLRPTLYAPRSYLTTLPTKERSEKLPQGWFNWIGPFWKIPDAYALQHQSLDSYLFLRFLRIAVIILITGACITWPVLLPINLTGGGTGNQLNMLSIGHIDNKAKGGNSRYYAHCFCGWLFFSFLLIIVTRESIFYINLRQAYLLSPKYAKRISSRTVLFTAVPPAYRNEDELRRVFGDTIEMIWILGVTTEVDNLVKKRDIVALKLEAAYLRLIDRQNTYTGNYKRYGGSLTTGKFGLYDAMHVMEEELEILTKKAKEAQMSYHMSDAPKLGSVFIGFASQSAAEVAFQTLTHHQALQMSPKYIGIQPSEVIWDALKLTWWQRVIRQLAVRCFITALIIFWTVPVAAIGFISNVEYLESFTWLHWLAKLPKSLKGLVSGLLPSAALSALMSIVPLIIRFCAKLAGEPSLARVELFTQNAYFWFQLVQVFLVVTTSSAASSVVERLISNPTGITALLATHLPTASNFYMSYFIIQGLTIASAVLSQAVEYFVFCCSSLLRLNPAKTPRRLHSTLNNFSSISWGSTLPPLTIIVVIGISYSCIAPLALGFAIISMSLFYFAYRYNVLFVTDSPVDTKGLIYPRALQQLFTGVYIGELALIGLFGISVAPGPAVCMVVLLIFTVLYHIAFKSALDPLLYNLPKSLESAQEPCAVSSSGENSSVNPTRKGGFIFRLLHYLLSPFNSEYSVLKALIWLGNHDLGCSYDSRAQSNAYYPPGIISERPLLWIPQDPAGTSKQLIKHSQGINITDEGYSWDKKNRVISLNKETQLPTSPERVPY